MNDAPIIDANVLQDIRTQSAKFRQLIPLIEWLFQQGYGRAEARDFLNKSFGVQGVKFSENTFETYLWRSKIKINRPKQGEWQKTSQPDSGVISGGVIESSVLDVQGSRSEETVNIDKPWLKLLSEGDNEDKPSLSVEVIRGIASSARLEEPLSIPVNSKNTK